MIVVTCIKNFCSYICIYNPALIRQVLLTNGIALCPRADSRVAHCIHHNHIQCRRRTNASLTPLGLGNILQDILVLSESQCRSSLIRNWHGKLPIVCVIISDACRFSTRIFCLILMPLFVRFPVYILTLLFIWDSPTSWTRWMRSWMELQ